MIIESVGCVLTVSRKKNWEQRCRGYTTQSLQLRTVVSIYADNAVHGPETLVSGVDILKYLVRDVFFDLSPIQPGEVSIECLGGSEVKSIA